MKNPFKEIFSNMNLTKGGSSDSVVGIDVGTSSIKVVELKKKGSRAVLETYGVVGLGGYAGIDIGAVTNLPVEKIVEALKEVLKQSGVSSKSVAFSIPVQSSLIFTLDLPMNASAKEGDMRAVVSTEARKYIPVPITEVTLDYFVLPKKEPSFEEVNNPDRQKEPNSTDVLVVALQNEAVSKYRSIVSQAELDASFFEIEIFSSIRANFEHELSLVLLMDFGASTTKLSLVEFGMVKGYHTIARGGANITDSISASFSVPFAEAEKMKKEHGLQPGGDKNVADIVKVHLDYIFSEASSVLLNHEKKYNRTVSKVILSGGGALLKGLAEEAAQNLKTEVQMGNAFSKVGAPAFLSKVLSNISPEFAVALGLALRKLQ